MVGTAVKAKICELEEEVREGCSRRVKNQLTGVLQCVLGKKRVLERFQDGFKENMSSNQLTIVIVDKSLVEKEPEVPTIP